MKRKQFPFVVCHAIPGRMRIRVPRIRTSPDLARELEQGLERLSYVKTLDVRPRTGSIILFHDPESKQRILQFLQETVSGVERKIRPERPRKQSGLIGQVVNAAALTAFMATLLIRWLLGKPSLSQAPFSLVGLVTMLGAIPLLRRAYLDFRQGKGAGLFPFLAGACGLAVATGQAMTALEIIWVLSAGMLLEEYVTERAKRTIREVFEVLPRQAELLVNGVEVLRPVSLLEEGDTAVARAGKRLPADGRVVKGEGLVDESHISGRAEPELRGKGDQVFAGTRVEQGVLYIRTERTGDDTYLSRVTRLVEDSLAIRGESEKRADVLARRLTRMGAAATLATLVLTGSAARAISVMLVVACPCATVLAASTAIAAAIANGARRQILIKGGLHLENVSTVQAVLFDKTGTVTVGFPELVEILPPGAEARVLTLAATAEARSEHPLARVLVEAAHRRGIVPQKANSVQEVLGRGVRAVTGSQAILVGSVRFMEKEGIDLSSFEEDAAKQALLGRTVLFVAAGGRAQGLIAFGAAIRPGTREVLDRLRQEGVSRLVLVSGDTESVARAVAEASGFDACMAPLLPDEKARLVERMETGGTRVLMVGDGVNDALALSKATVGVAMGAGGSEVAVEAADITLAGSDLNDLVFLRMLSRRALNTVEQNFWMASATNLAGILAGFGGWLAPWAAGLLHVGHTLGILLNSSRLLTWSPEEETVSDQEF